MHLRDAGKVAEIRESGNSLPQRSHNSFPSALMRGAWGCRCLGLFLLIGDLEQSFVSILRAALAHDTPACQVKTLHDSAQALCVSYGVGVNSYSLFYGVEGTRIPGRCMPRALRPCAVRWTSTRRCGPSGTNTSRYNPPSRLRVCELSFGRKLHDSRSHEYFVVAGVLLFPLPLLAP